MHALINDNKIEVHCTFDEKEIVKAIGNYRFNKFKKCWEFPLSSLTAIIENLRVEADENVMTEYRRLKEQQKALEAKIEIANRIKSGRLKISDGNFTLKYYDGLFTHQKEALTISGLFDSYALFMETGCVDLFTEYLSPSGWRRIDNYNGGLVAQYNLDGTAEFVKPSEYIVKPCNEMYELKHSRGLDQMLSPEHRVLWYDRFNKHHITSIVELAQKHWKNKTGFKAKIQTTFNLKSNNKLHISNDNLRLQVAVIADGSFTKDKSNLCNIRIKKERKVRRLKYLLNQCNIHYKEYFSKKGFHIFRFYAPIKTKVFGKDFWNCSYEQRKIICDEVKNWDGTVRKSDASEFFTTLKESADFIQYCFSSTGRRASLRFKKRKNHTEFIVHAIGKGKNSNYIWLGRYRDNINMVAASPNGLKYSFTVPSSFLIFRRNGNIFVSGNTGKTLVAIKLIEHWKVPTMVIAPLSILESVWIQELEKWSRLRVVNLWHNLKEFENDYDVYIINYEHFKKLENTEDKIKFLIVDESSKLKNNRSQITKAILNYKDTIQHKLILSGKPAPNNMLEYWGQMCFINPELLSDNYYKFRNKYFYSFGYGGYQYAPYPGAKEKIMNQISKQAFFVKKEDCLDLPERIFETRIVEMDEIQQKAYDEMEKLNIMEFRSYTTLGANELAKIMKLREITSGFAISTERMPFEISKSKLIELEAVLDEINPDRQVIIWINFHYEIEMIKKLLKKEYVTLYGDMPQKEKERSINEFKRGAVKYLIAHPLSGGFGLNFAQCSYVIWFSMNYSLEQYAQANDRIYRIGQVNRCTYIHLLAKKSIDQVIYKTLQKKERMSDACLSMLKGDNDG